MTEQPSAAMELLSVILPSCGRAGICRSPPCSCAESIDALCEQRVKDERDRCAAVADNQAKDYAALYVLEGFPEDLQRRDAAERVARCIRAPAERPEGPQQTIIHAYLCVGLPRHVDCQSKPGPDCPKCTRLFAGGRQEDSSRGIGVEERTQETRPPGCGTSEPLPDCMMPDGAQPCRGYQELLADRNRWRADNKRLGEALINTNAGLRELQTVIRERDEARNALAARPSALASTGEQPGCVNLFVGGEFTAHSGGALPFKIDCDALTDDDIAALAAEATRRLPGFATVYGVPRGGLRFAAALERYETRSPLDPTLIVDDVLTTGRSMEEFKANWPGGGNVFLGVVIFARGPCPDWVTPLFSAAASEHQAEIAWLRKELEEVAAENGRIASEHQSLSGIIDSMRVADDANARDDPVDER